MAAPLYVGPFRSSGGLADGLVDVRFDGAILRLTRFGNPLDVLDRYRFAILGFFFVFLIGAAYADGPVMVVLLIVAAACLLSLLVLGIAEMAVVVAGIGFAVLSVATKAGRRRLAESFRGARATHAGTLMEIAEPDITLMDPVYGAWRAHLVLYTTTGELRLSGWFWRRGQLDRLQRALAR